MEIVLWIAVPLTLKILSISRLFAWNTSSCVTRSAVKFSSRKSKLYKEFKKTLMFLKPLKYCSCSASGLKTHKLTYAKSKNGLRLILWNQGNNPGSDKYGTGSFLCVCNFFRVQKYKNQISRDILERNVLIKCTIRSYWAEFVHLKARPGKNCTILHSLCSILYVATCECGGKNLCL